jgi:N-acyl-D-aspartate/D-glutamate deacylase
LVSFTHRPASAPSARRPPRIVAGADFRYVLRMRADVLLRGGTICDGSGAPAATGDLAIADGHIVAVGRFDGAARRVVDVGGLIVAPGFIDVHTHYDAQVTWDSLCTPTCWHGVTSVVIGNCGFALAPCRPAARDSLLRMLEHVEGMPYESLRAGVTWDWETIPEYVAMLERRGLGPNVGVLLGHSAIRSYVLGDAAYARPAADDEVARMQALVRDGMAAGALGLATSLSPGHVGEAGRPVPSRLATRAELGALTHAMAESGRGVLEITPETFPISAGELDALQGLARATGRPVSFSAILDVPERDGAWEPVFARLRAGAGSGAAVVPQVSCRPMRFDFDLETGCASLDALPCWRRFRSTASRRDRRALLGDAEFRAAFRREIVARSASPASRRWAAVELVHSAARDRAALVGCSLAEIAAARGGDVVDALFDTACDDADARFSMLLLNFDEERVAELLRQPESLIALSDAGAHVSVLCDAGYATYLLGHWVRERGLFTCEEAVRRLTSMPAAIYGIPQRGRLVAGAVADVTCFDPARVDMLPPQRVRDFPAGAERYVARATGIEHVFIAGEEFLAGGEWTGAHPGRVIKP